MKMMAILAAGTAAILTPAQASAAEIIYTFTGDFTGTLDGNEFSTSAVFTAVGDTETVSTENPTLRVDLTSVSAVANDVVYTLTTLPQFYRTPSGFVGLFFGTGMGVPGGGSFAGQNASLVGYDGISNFATTPLSPTVVGGGANFQTDRGRVTLTSFTNGTFGATVGAVPEPGTWALMLLGFGAVGGAMRARRRKTNVTVSYA